MKIEGGYDAFFYVFNLPMFPTRNIWRLRFFWPDDRTRALPYRLLYAPDWGNRTFIGLYLMKRGENYGETDTKFTDILCHRYDRIGLPMDEDC